jgi:hypothetical protein
MQHRDCRPLDMHRFASKWTGWDGQSNDVRSQRDASEFLTMLFHRLARYTNISKLSSVANRIELENTVTQDRIVQGSEISSAILLPVTGQRCIADR